MNRKPQWFLLENGQEYQEALMRYKEIKNAANGTKEHREKRLLVHLIHEYESKHYSIPVPDPIEIIKIRMSELGYRMSDLANEYGDKGTVSKVLNYKQSLSLTMIRKFSELLKVPIDSLIREYNLRN